MSGRAIFRGVVQVGVLAAWRGSALPRRRRCIDSDRADMETGEQRWSVENYVNINHKIMCSRT